MHGLGRIMVVTALLLLAACNATATTPPTTAADGAPSPEVTPGEALVVY